MGGKVRQGQKSCLRFGLQGLFTLGLDLGPGQPGQRRPGRTDRFAAGRAGCGAAAAGSLLVLCWYFVGILLLLCWYFGGVGSGGVVVGGGWWGGGW